MSFSASKASTGRIPPSRLLEPRTQQTTNRRPISGISRPATAGASVRGAWKPQPQLQPRPAEAPEPSVAAAPPEAASKQDAAASQVSAFLSDSRILAERVSKKCSNSGCAFLCTGLTPKHCCRMCAKSPGAHGPKCQKRLLACSTPGCNYAVTGLTPRCVHSDAVERCIQPRSPCCAPRPLLTRSLTRLATLRPSQALLQDVRGLQGSRR